MTDETAPTATNPGADHSQPDLQADEHQRWIETVLADLEHRPRAARDALTKALLDGGDTVTSVGHVSGLELNTRKSAENEHSTCDQSADPSALHVSGTTFPSKIRTISQRVLSL